MPKFFCDYCDVYLTHDSMSVRKSHNTGRNHLRNVTDYYQQIGHEKAQSVIDSITNSYAAEGLQQPNPMLQHAGAPPGFPPMGFPGMPPPPFAGPPGQPGMMPPGGRGMPFPPFAPNGAPPNMPNGMPFNPPQGFPPNFQPQFPSGGFNMNQQPSQMGQHGPPGGSVPPPGQVQSPPPGYGAPPGSAPPPGMNRR
ncbi:U1 small nuclear ribonucleoprotein C [Lithohypha guttulata]|uniref:U1 small nuclear ribonucleoprotein C n=1 Tax=Lithohypha guttulata TaxID=1690604 RepID=A0AAN7SUK2_9EURO|nr:U1 small nuclear ribonucleoprotein C [Lithohypha guttulata]KAK5081972.1 U1 small nuclear ribonucleoprotein C [Lithohypha guttulata]KAK5105573.1 U1 small nuclear ribonucleoprotein C [Lithohypha guttulata]